MRTTASIIPGLRYRDAPRAIAWLCDVFGFERHLVVPGDTDGTIAHAQLTRGSSMIMLGSIDDSPYGRLMRQPAEAGGSTLSIYVVVADIDAHYAHAKKAGADIVAELAEQDYGGKLYMCRDIEGHVWGFGSYDPWAEPAS
ncbi:MAG TPA: VOC family protein [Vineibacter sp.]|nr:VOC family protein [Vineibacter sp.]